MHNGDAVANSHIGDAIESVIGLSRAIGGALSLCAMEATTLAS